MAYWNVKYQLPDYNKYFDKEIEANSQAEAKAIFKADMPGARIVGNPTMKTKRR
jgi:hypothetical protein|tara:strand:- start:1037 stop:1198 length:162 start_codon:yes stop_codon:yes gene_type:complete